MLLKTRPILILSIFFILFIQCQPDCSCSTHYLPVCGMDSLTYQNECEANCMNIAFTYGICPLIEKGTILFLGNTTQNGCGWLVQTDNESTLINNLLLPNDLSVNYKEKGLRIEITYRPNDVIYECLSDGVIYSVMKNIEVINIRRL